VNDEERQRELDHSWERCPASREDVLEVMEAGHADCPLCGGDPQAHRPEEDRAQP